MTLYILIFALVFVVTADLLGWTTTSALASGVWNAVLQLGAVGVALAVAWGIWKWTEGDQEDRANRRAELLTFFGATVLSAWILTSSLSFLLSLLVLAVLLFVLWNNREHLPDLWGGLYLRLNKTRSVILDGEPAAIHRISFLTHASKLTAAPPTAGTANLSPPSTALPPQRRLPT